MNPLRNANAVDAEDEENWQNPSVIPDIYGPPLLHGLIFVFRVGVIVEIRAPDTATAALTMMMIKWLMLGQWVNNFRRSQLICHLIIISSLAITLCFVPTKQNWWSFRTLPLGWWRQKGQSTFDLTDTHSANGLLFRFGRHQYILPLPFSAKTHSFSSLVSISGFRD